MAEPTYSPAPSLQELDGRFSERLRSIASEGPMLHTVDWMQLARLLEDAASVIDRQRGDFARAEKRARHAEGRMSRVREELNRRRDTDDASIVTRLETLLSSAPLLRSE